MIPPDSMAHGGSKANDSNVSRGGKGIECLGEALAGVHIGGRINNNGNSNNNNNSSSSFGVGSSALASTAVPFAIAPGSLRESSGNNNNNGWGSFVTLTESETSGTPMDNSGPHVRNESLELFLSQSPSQTLGEDVFKFSSHTNLPALAEEKDHTGGIGGGGVLPTVGSFVASNNTINYGGDLNRSFAADGVSSIRRRTDSPTASITGTTTSSRSVSPPYGSSSDVSGSRTMQAFQNHHRFESAATAPSPAPFPDPAVSNQHLHHSTLQQLQQSLPNIHVQHLSPYAKDRSQMYKNQTLSNNSFVDHGRYDTRMNGQQTTTNLPPIINSGAVPANGQVLYMAMPSPDGRGQVLQPVQMMQLPGKPYTYVVPGGAGSSSGGALRGGGSDVSQQHHQQQQALSMLPSIQGNDIPDYGLGGGGARNNRATSGNMDNSYAIDNYEMTRGQAQTYGDLGHETGAAGYGNNNNSKAGTTDSTIQYATDPALASLYASTQRPPLESLLGQIRRLSRDQVGCRLVQQALDEDGPMGATLILQEGLPFWGEAMVDPFGNYLFQKILEKVTPEERIMLVKSVSSRLVNASLNLHGTRSVQKVVELCAQDEQDGRTSGLEESAASVLTEALAPSAARLCIDSHGNHVIQRILLRFGPGHSQFVFDAVAASVGEVARHRHGCCVIQRCLDSPQSESRAHLVRRIVQKSLELMQDAYGNYVVQYVLDVCSDDDVHAVCDSVVGKANLLAIQKFSSNVMEKCLERCADRTKELYLAEMSDPVRVRELMMDPFGNYVIQRALSVATHSQAIRLVEAMRPHLLAVPVTGPNGARNGGVRNTAGGRRIIAKICRRFPNFTLNPLGTQDELYNQNKNNHRYLNHHQQSGMLQSQHPSLHTAYAPIGAPLQYYASPESNLPQMSQNSNLPQQQQFQYGLGGGNTAYYNPFADAHGGYPGM